MSLGHNESVWADPRYRDSMLGGIRWVLGLEPGSAIPNPEVDSLRVEKGRCRRRCQTGASIGAVTNVARSLTCRTYCLDLTAMLANMPTASSPN